MNGGRWKMEGKRCTPRGNKQHNAERTCHCQDRKGFLHFTRAETGESGQPKGLWLQQTDIGLRKPPEGDRIPHRSDSNLLKGR
jgi:hypothetical protein